MTSLSDKSEGDLYRILRACYVPELRAIAFNLALRVSGCKKDVIIEKIMEFSKVNPANKFVVDLFARKKSTSLPRNVTTTINNIHVHSCQCVKCSTMTMTQIPYGSIVHRSQVSPYAGTLNQPIISPLVPVRKCSKCQKKLMSPYPLSHMCTLCRFNASRNEYQKLVKVLYGPVISNSKTSDVAFPSFYIDEETIESVRASGDKKCRGIVVRSLRVDSDSSNDQWAMQPFGYNSAPMHEPKYIKINGKSIKPSQSISRRPEGDCLTALPCDIGSYCIAGDNVLSVAAYHVDYAYVVELVDITTGWQLCNSVRTLEMSEAMKFAKKLLNHGSADEDISVVNHTMSLRCPLAIVKIDRPARSAHCEHLQCFDLESYVDHNMRVKRWQCPVCQKKAPISSLVVDPFLQTIIVEASSKGATEVALDNDGNWSMPSASPSVLGPPPSQNRYNTSVSLGDINSIIDDNGVDHPATKKRKIVRDDDGLTLFLRTNQSMDCDDEDLEHLFFGSVAQPDEFEFDDEFSSDYALAIRNTRAGDQSDGNQTKTLGTVNDPICLD